MPTWKFKKEKGVLLEDIDLCFTTGLWGEFKSILFNFKMTIDLKMQKNFIGSTRRK